jgi:hypothetical protein
MRHDSAQVYHQSVGSIRVSLGWHPYCNIEIIVEVSMWKIMMGILVFSFIGNLRLIAQDDGSKLEILKTRLKEQIFLGQEMLDVLLKELNQIESEVIEDKKKAPSEDGAF